MASTENKNVMRVYKQSLVVPFEEDYTREFKGHRNICIEDLPPWCWEVRGKSDQRERRTRSAISRNLCGFLNTGEGGTIYIGILDDGTVEGIRLTPLQKDHIKESLDDVMQRFNPPVPKHRYKINYVPVIEDGDDPTFLCRVEEKHPVKNNRPHILRSYNYCWCDNEAVALFNMGVMAIPYVIEICIQKWNPADPHNEPSITDMPLYPVYEAEDGECYFRNQATVEKYSLSEVRDMTKEEVKEFYLRKIQELKVKITAHQNVLQQSLLKTVSAFPC